MTRNRVKSQTVDNFDGTTVLKELAEQNGGMMNYYDPLALKSQDGSSINLRSNIYEDNDLEETFEAVNDAVKSSSGNLHIETDYAIKQALTVDRVSLPVWTTPSIFVSDRQDLPVKDALSRIAVSEDEIRLDEVSEVGEPNSSTAEVDTVEVTDDTIDQYTYNIEQVYVRKEISDKMVATNRYSPETTKTELGAEGIARYMEKQAIWGTSYDAGSFEGLYDFVDTSRTFDATDESISADMFRDVVTALNKRGVANENQMLVTDHDTFSELKTALQDFQRFNQPTDTYSFGAIALEVDGVMINPSHGIEDAGNGQAIFNFDATAHAWYYLAETTVKTSGIVQTNDTTEEMLVYEMATFGSEARSNVSVVENIGEDSA